MNNKFVEKTFLVELEKIGIELEDISVYIQEGAKSNAFCYKYKFTSEYIECADLYYYGSNTYSKNSIPEDIVKNIAFELGDVERAFGVIYRDRDAHLGYVVMQVLSKYFLDLKDKKMVNFDTEEYAKKLLQHYGSLENFMLNFENCIFDDIVEMEH